MLPLFPQSSGTTTGAVYDQLGGGAAHWRTLPELRVIADYCNDAAYIAALAQPACANTGSAARPRTVTC